MQRILCVNPEHKENTPSMVVYDEYAHCFGCGYRIANHLLGISGISAGTRSKLQPTDLKGELERIKVLPLASVRGLSLPVDADSYFILWPDGSYYKRRKFLPGSGPKYINPRGHEKPLFIPRQTPGCKSLVVVEGELNALSLASLEPNFDICSPGSCTDFNEGTLNKNSKYFLQYTRFYCILDADLPGLTAAKKFKTLLLKLTPHVQIILMKRDANDLLVAGELEKEIKSWGST